MNKTEQADFAKMFIEVLKEDREIRQMLLDLVSSCPNIKTMI